LGPPFDFSDRSYEVSDPTLDSHVVTLKDSGADLLIALVTPKAAAQAIRKVAELKWKPTFFIGNPASSVAAVLRPAGFENAQGIISSVYLKDPTDPANKDDPGTKAWISFMDRYYPEGDKANSSNVYGYVAAQAFVHVLKRCGDELKMCEICSLLEAG
jgi:ABC-type branched-subunit amino acid transport system substrate-binding protein